MCRYDGCLGDSYKTRFACFVCKKAFKTYDRRSLNRRTDTRELHKCPECGSIMSNVGKDFKPPRKEAVKQWKKLEYITNILHFNWQSCGCNGPGPLPIVK